VIDPQHLSTQQPSTMREILKTLPPLSFEDKQVWADLEPEIKDSAPQERDWHDLFGLEEQTF
jgi:hypothetical protein